MSVKLRRTLKGKGANVANSEIAKGDRVRITDGPFANLEYTEGEVTKVDPRSVTYPVTVAIPSSVPGRDPMEIPLSTREFTKI